MYLYINITLTNLKRHHLNLVSFLDQQQQWMPFETLWLLEFPSGEKKKKTATTNTTIATATPTKTSEKGF